MPLMFSDIFLYIFVAFDLMLKYWSLRFVERKECCALWDIQIKFFGAYPCRCSLTCKWWALGSIAIVIYLSIYLSVFLQALFCFVCLFLFTSLSKLYFFIYLCLFMSLSKLYFLNYLYLFMSLSGTIDHISNLITEVMLHLVQFLFSEALKQPFVSVSLSSYKSDLRGDESQVIF